jgi:hypothetical protein
VETSPTVPNICGNNAQCVSPGMAARVAAEEFRGSTRGTGVRDGGVEGGSGVTTSRLIDKQYQMLDATRS